ncbi:MAG: hypothetical protein ABL890_02575 [Candidatus Peribacteraceae bacterium]
MMQISDRIRHFFYATVHPHTFAVLRIGFALFLMLYWYAQWREVTRLTPAGGITLPAVVDYPLWLDVILRPSLGVAHGFFVLIFVALVFLLLGSYTRTAAVVLLLLSAHYHVWNQWMFATSYYRLFQFTLAVMLLPGADRAFSLAMLRRHGSVWEWEPMSVLPLRFLGLQLTATYLGVGWQKLILPGWTSGEILFRSFTSRWGTEFGFFLARTMPSVLLDWMMRTTLVIELAMPFALWIRRLQVFAFLGGFVFHTMVTLTMSIWWFQIMVPMYVVFLDPAVVFARLRIWSGNRIPLRPAGTE